MPLNSSRLHLFGLLAGLFLAAGLCCAALILADAWTRISETQVVNATGSVRCDARSNLVVWRVNFSSARHPA